MPPEAPPPQMILMQIFFGKVVCMSASIVAKLRIADLLADQPLTAGELATKTNTHEASLFRVMRALASTGVFKTDAEGKFHLTEVGQLLRTGVPGSMRGILDYAGSPWSWQSYGAMLHSVQTGETAFNHVFGEGCFDYLSKHKEESEVFNEGMTGFSAVTAVAVREAYDFSGINTLIDVGGGHGTLLLKILEANPTLNGVVFDLGHVVAGAKPNIQAAHLENRCRTASGSFFEGVPSGADAIIMKHIIHDWNDADCTTILKHCRAALPSTGKLLIVDMVVPPGDEPHPAKWLDLEMLAVASGKERTEAEFAELLAGAGFKLNRIVPTKSPVCIVEGLPI